VHCFLFSFFNNETKTELHQSSSQSLFSHMSRHILCILSFCLHLPIYFWPELSNGVIKFFTMPSTVERATNFETKLTITRLSQKIIARCLIYSLFSNPGYIIMVSCNFFSFKTPVVMTTNCL